MTTTRASRMTYQRVGDGHGRRRSRSRSRAAGERQAVVLHGVGGEPHRGGDHENGMERHVEQRQARRPPQRLAQVRRRGQAVERLLRDTQRRLERRRVGREVEVGPRQRLDPHRRHQHRPPPPPLVPAVLPSAAADVRPPPMPAAVRHPLLLPATSAAHHDWFSNGLQGQPARSLPPRGQARAVPACPPVRPSAPVAPQSPLRPPSPARWIALAVFIYLFIHVRFHV
jgi:hypothetical protein|uniref:Uncharacterized protein n=1 Tax=Zea mays TaxID=4577 RepID=A0A804MKV8_MAIZE